MKKIKVGILGETDLDKFFKNGLYQNTWSLAKLLGNSGEFEATLISKDIPKSKDLIGVKCEKLGLDSLKDKDVIITGAVDLPPNYADTLQKKGVKIILVKYGNHLGGDTASFVQFSLGFKPVYEFNEWLRTSLETKADLILYSPHFEFQKQYLSLTSGVSEEKVLTCPYIWHPFFIQAMSRIREKRFGEAYDLAFKRDDYRNKAVACVEPSIYFMKTNLLPILILNHVHEQDSELMSKGYIFNSKSLLNSNEAESLRRKLNMLQGFKDGVLELSNRFPMYDIMANKARVLVSHQILNSLNYTYFEFALSGYPFVHNSDLLSDYGYYYEGNNVLDAAEKTKEALNHDLLSSKELSAYNDSCLEMIWKHSPDNSKNISDYVGLIKSVL